MKILVFAPWTPSEMRPRSWHLIEYMRRNHEVHVVCATWSEQDQSDLDLITASSVRGIRVSRIAAVLRAGLGALRGRSLQQSFVSSRNLKRELDRAVSEIKPDLVYFNVIRSAHMIDGIDGPARFIDLDELRSGYYRQMRTASRNPLWRIIARIEARRLREAETAAMDSFDAVIFSSPTDVGLHDRTHLVRTPCNFLVPEGARENGHRRRLVFVGRQCYRANVEAIVWFAGQVLPRLTRTTLAIVGERPTRQVRDLQSDAVTVTGRVPEVRSHYESAHVSIVPIRMATGVQLKLVESLALGVPTICTPIVANGAGVRHEVECLIADTADEWVDAIGRIFSDSELSKRLSERSKAWVRETYDETALVGALERALEDSLRASHARRPNHE